MVAGIIFNGVGITMAALALLAAIPLLAIGGLAASVWQASRAEDPDTRDAAPEPAAQGTAGPEAAAPRTFAPWAPAGAAAPARERVTVSPD